MLAHGDGRPHGHKRDERTDITLGSAVTRQVTVHAEATECTEHSEATPDQEKRVKCSKLCKSQSDRLSLSREPINQNHSFPLIDQQTQIV